VNTIKAVHEHADLLRASIASAGNDHRLGANEAPPAIISIFLGEQLSAALDEIEKKVRNERMSPEEKTEVKINIGRIPEILLDNTDRNRTSPFAFTGNKFELRAVGSAANCSAAMSVLNLIVANQLKSFYASVEALIKKGQKKDDAILRVLRGYIIDSKNIRFEGNGYSEEWVKEAKKRGLSNVTTTPHALDFMVTPKSKKLFSDNSIFTPREIEARHEILLETYIKKIQIEARVMGTLAINHILPAAIKFQKLLADTAEALHDVGLKGDATKTHIAMAREISEHVNIIKENADAMVEARKKANKIAHAREKAIAYCEKVKPYFDTIRYHVDKLELIVDDEMWPLPKYREMVSIK
jgi:glutamine synthetase